MYDSHWFVVSCGVCVDVEEKQEKVFVDSEKMCSCAI